ncbi:MAG: DUF4178 domain-containing protein [bacterium]|nr:DUF4178 domain-containing protein [bacterium]
MINLGKKWFGKGDEDERDLTDIQLGTMQLGDLVDYDLKTWEVTSCCIYDYDGFPAQEWQLSAAEEVRFLERAEEDGRTEWTLTQSIDATDIQEDVISAITSDEDPPETIHFEARAYKAVESDSGLQYDVGADGVADESAGREFVNWSYESKDGRVLFLVQWGERRVSVYEGEIVNEYSFTDFLPGGER